MITETKSLNHLPCDLRERADWHRNQHPNHQLILLQIIFGVCDNEEIKHDPEKMT